MAILARLSGAVVGGAPAGARRWHAPVATATLNVRIRRQMRTPEVSAPRWFVATRDAPVTRTTEMVTNLSSRDQNATPLTNALTF
jgi:hypothetical protein